MRLDLRAPLFYAEDPNLEPFVYGGSFKTSGLKEPPLKKAWGEALFCFELDPVQSLSIEPDREHFLGNLVFAARTERDSPGTIQLPAGLYLFEQKREVLGREDCIDLAIEQQKDGLWERLKPSGRLYLRYLFEDGSPVTQLFRSYEA
jgi:hypothetical protein